MTERRDDTVALVAEPSGGIDRAQALATRGTGGVTWRTGEVPVPMVVTEAMASGSRRPHRTAVDETLMPTTGKGR